MYHTDQRMNYYNEWDSFAADWLRELIKEGLIPDGEVDDRSIADVEPRELKGFTQCHFFAGIGGWSRALELAGWSSDRPVWTGSPPCQPFSNAGKKQGKSDDRHLWPSFFQLIKQCGPPVVFMEQVATSIKSGWLDEVQTDMEAEHYSVGAIVFSASSVGALHRRSRLWIVADSDPQRWKGFSGSRETRTSKHNETGDLADSNDSGQYTGSRREIGIEQVEERNNAWWGGKIDDVQSSWRNANPIKCRDGQIRLIPTEPELFPLVDGLSSRVGALRGAGNSIVPQAAAEIIKAVM
tara:strand:+ start:65 stop:949 length:885 start_codon:yes stop_codon:yes gene_type:complete